MLVASLISTDVQDESTSFSGNARARDASTVSNCPKDVASGNFRKKTRKTRKTSERRCITLVIT